MKTYWKPVCMAMLSAGAAGALLPACAHAASIAYFTTSYSNGQAYLIDWEGAQRARLAQYFGARRGTVTEVGAQRVITFDAPITNTYGNFDSCGERIKQRMDLNQVGVTDNASDGTSQIVEVGTLTNIGGCTDGQVTPFGDLGDAGTTLERLDMRKRPSVADLTPGTELAGFSEERTSVDDAHGEGEDVVTLQTGTALFQSTGHVVPAAFDPDQWLVFSLSGFQRAYTRLALDKKTGGELWLSADWVNGKAARVWRAVLVKPRADEGFGTEKKASRMWESGFFADTRQQLFVYLYQGGSGERVFKDLDQGSETRSPITWSFSGRDIVVSRSGGRYHRTWVPLRRERQPYQWVMESETYTDDTGTYPFINPRVILQIDTGRAVPP